MTKNSAEKSGQTDTSPASEAVRQTEASLPETCLPVWEVEEEMPEPRPLGLRNLAGFIGPGIVMCGIQIGGGEWLFGDGRLRAMQRRAVLGGRRPTVPGHVVRSRPLRQAWRQ